MWRQKDVKILNSDKEAEKARASDTRRKKPEGRKSRESLKRNRGENTMNQYYSQIQREGDPHRYWQFLRNSIQAVPSIGGSTIT